MIHFNPLFETLEQAGAGRWVRKLREDVPRILSPHTHGDLRGWQAVLDALPKLPADRVILNSDVVTVHSEQEISAQTVGQIRQSLLQFHPWRKGPFNIHGIEIDAEWRSDLKWNRLTKAVDLKGKLVLDIGCGNGYYGWRMLGAGARMVIGIEPFLKNVIQYRAVAHFIGPLPFFVLPIGIQDMPEELPLFDTVFSMGVLYHRRSPFDHLYQLKSFLKPGGEVILETLVIEGNANEALVPEGRYAKMRNVWFIPSVATLHGWLKRTGFKNIRLLDVSKTTAAEQRRTEWMTYESLSDFLDPDNPALTVEGYPAPLRALFCAVKP